MATNSRSGKDKNPRSHLHPKDGITAIATPTVKQDPIAQKNCNEKKQIF